MLDIRSPGSVDLHQQGTSARPQDDEQSVGPPAWRPHYMRDPGFVSDLDCRPLPTLHETLTQIGEDLKASVTGGGARAGAALRSSSGFSLFDSCLMGTGGANDGGESGLYVGAGGGYGGGARSAPSAAPWRVLTLDQRSTTSCRFQRLAFSDLMLLAKMHFVENRSPLLFQQGTPQRQGRAVDVYSRTLSSASQDPKTWQEALTFETRVRNFFLDSAGGEDKDTEMNYSTSHDEDDRSLVFAERWRVDWVKETAQVTLENLNFVFAFSIEIELTVAASSVAAERESSNSRRPNGLEVVVERVRYKSEDELSFAPEFVAERLGNEATKWRNWSEFLDGNFDKTDYNSNKRSAKVVRSTNTPSDGGQSRIAAEGAVSTEMMLKMAEL